MILNIVSTGFIGCITDINQKNFFENINIFDLNIDYNFFFTSLKIKHIFNTITAKKIFDKFSSNNIRTIPCACDSYSRYEKNEQKGKNIAETR